MARRGKERGVRGDEDNERGMSNGWVERRGYEGLEGGVLVDTSFI